MDRHCVTCVFYHNQKTGICQDPTNSVMYCMSHFLDIKTLWMSECDFLSLSVFCVEYGPVHMKIKLPQKTSCMYICQHCLVHLGDIGQYNLFILSTEHWLKLCVYVTPEQLIFTNSVHSDSQCFCEMDIFTRSLLASAGINCCRVSACLSVCHKSVFY